MQITVVNSSALRNEDVMTTIRAVNRQIAEDFYPYWGYRATLRLEGRASTKPEIEEPWELRGDAIIYLWTKAEVEGVLGYHAENFRGLPCGFVFTDLAQELGEPYSVTLSHEALELIADANVNKLAAGPHPAEPRAVLHWYEMCDAVQAETYKIDGVDVSNFVLPLYFTPGEQIGGLNDFLGRTHRGRTLQSFGVNPGGYVGYLDPLSNQMETWHMPDDEDAKRRLSIKQETGLTRRSLRKTYLGKLALEPDLLAAQRNI
jgi:hypothetical protein